MQVTAKVPAFLRESPGQQLCPGRCLHIPGCRYCPGKANEHPGLRPGCELPPSRASGMLSRAKGVDMQLCPGRVCTCPGALENNT